MEGSRDFLKPLNGFCELSLNEHDCISATCMMNVYLLMGLQLQFSAREGTIRNLFPERRS